MDPRVALATALSCAAVLAACSGSGTDGTSSAASATGLPDGFVRLVDVAPDVLQEMRYAGEHNFVGRPVTGYETPDCWLTRPAAEALADVQSAVSARGYTLKVYDCYRPQRAVDDFVRWAQDPDDDVTRAEFYPRLEKDVLFPEGYIAERSGHSRGSTVDLTLVPAGKGVSPGWVAGDTLVDCTAPVGERFPDTSIDMGTGFDCFDPLAATASTEVSAAAQRNRRLLLDEMTKAGFTNLPEEWWHFTLVDEPYPDAYVDVPITGSPGLVALPDGREMYGECAGSGSPTVVLVSGTRNAYDVWSAVQDPSSGVVASPDAVMPRLAGELRVCAYDRPGSQRLDGSLSPTTPVAQPTSAQQGAEDLHAWLGAAGVPPPYVVVGHSWGGLIATVFAAEHSDEVAGLVLVDPASVFLQDALSPDAWQAFLALTRDVAVSAGEREAPDYSNSLAPARDQFPPASVPAVVLTSDQTFDFGTGSTADWPAWLEAATLLAERLDATHVTRTSSGHLIPLLRPDVVADAVDQVVAESATGPSPGG